MGWKRQKHPREPGEHQTLPLLQIKYFHKEDIKHQNFVDIATSSITLKEDLPHGDGCKYEAKYDIRDGYMYVGSKTFTDMKTCTFMVTTTSYITTTALRHSGLHLSKDEFTGRNNDKTYRR